MSTAKHTLLALVFLSVISSSYARTLIQYEIDTNKKSCKVIDYFNTAKPESTKWIKASWTGKCAAGYAEGTGSLTAESKEGSNEIYEGKIVKGTLEGEVLINRRNEKGVKQTGKATFSGGIMNGNGEITSTHADGQTITYEGQFKDGLPHGTGKITSTKTNISGEFEEGKPRGNIKLSPPNGDWSFEGRINNQNKKEGKWVLTVKNGVRIIANYENGQPSSKVRIEYANGSTYEGQIAKLKPNGQGRMTDPSGNWFEGNFKDGQPDGDGVVSNSKGVFEVTFIDGKATPRKKEVAPQQSRSSGESGLEALGNILEAFAVGYQAVNQAQQRNAIEAERAAQNSPAYGQMGVTCFKKREWTTGFTKNCVYDCVGNEAVQTIGSTQICPLTINH